MHECSTAPTWVVLKYDYIFHQDLHHIDERYKGIICARMQS
jgi:hypothetical protein